MADLVRGYSLLLGGGEGFGDSEIMRLATASEYCPTHVSPNVGSSRRNLTYWLASSRLYDFVQCFRR